jgi:chorismate-pyruvate lyase
MSPDLRVLIDLFYAAPAELGEFVEVDAPALPLAERQLLAHGEHMTVAMEAFHGVPVDVQVLATHVTPTHYARKIVLTRSSDQRIVQFGLVRLNVSFLGDDARREIESQSAPLGRILIQHNILRTVRLLSLWRIAPGPELRRLFATTADVTCFGRTALIYCNGLPAVELLEIVPPR